MSKPAEQIQMAQQSDDEIEIDLLELFYFLRSRFVFIIITFLAGALGAGLITCYFITPKYEATSKLYMVSASSDSVVDLTDLNLGTSLSTDYEKLLYIRPIFEEIIEEEKLPYTYGQLVAMVKISAIEDTRILTVTVTSENPSEAQKIANDLADKAVTYLPDLMETSAPNIAERAIYPEQPSSPNLTKNVLIGALAGTVLAVGVLTVFFVMDDTLQTAEDVEKAFGIMPFTVIPEGDMESISDKAEKEMRRKRRHRRNRLQRLLRKRRRRK